MPPLSAEIQRRRTFAIISHPDAGKTTLTERLLLLGGAIHLVGSVKARRGQRHSRSDWMEIERQRGISVTTTVLQFQSGDRILNLLDTPGHEDFGEDTYRTLLAVDSAIMLLDVNKGVEAQTRKLFRICRQRGIPIVTFVNKLDRAGGDPLGILSQVEEVLGIHAVPVTWPTGTGPEFLGVVDLLSGLVHLRERVAVDGDAGAPIGLDDPAMLTHFGDAGLARIQEEIALIHGTLGGFDRERFLAGEVTPVFYGSAVNGTGVRLLLERFLDLAPPPGPRPTADGPLAPDAEVFSGFIFKVQANMDRAHRDRIAFMRVCSGRFVRGMTVRHARLDRELRLSQSHRLFGDERDLVEEAYPGDIVGLVNPGIFSVGDTLCAGGRVEFERIPRFPPEHFVKAYLAQPSQRKAMDKGIHQLAEEGVIQVLADRGSTAKDPVLAAVGVLQIEVARFRLEGEYNATVRMERLPYSLMRWVSGSRADLDELAQMGTTVMYDLANEPVALFREEWDLRYVQKKLPALVFSETSP
jgi:peptide chain release factor 3